MRTMILFALLLCVTPCSFGQNREFHTGAGFVKGVHLGFEFLPVQRLGMGVDAGFNPWLAAFQGNVYLKPVLSHSKAYVSQPTLYTQIDLIGATGLVSVILMDVRLGRHFYISERFGLKTELGMIFLENKRFLHVPEFDLSVFWRF